MHEFSVGDQFTIHSKNICLTASHFCQRFLHMEVLGVRCSDRGHGEQVEFETEAIFKNISNWLAISVFHGFSRAASEETCKNQSRAIRFAYEHRSK